MIWAHYILQVNIYLTLFYCFYKVLLARETYFHFNRIYLVAGAVLSLAIPFLQFDWFTKQEVAQPIYDRVAQLSTMVQQVSFEAMPDEAFNWGRLIVLIYLAGVTLYVIKLVFQLSLLRKLLEGLNVGQAFSFFNKKVVDPQLPEATVINHHEDIHIKQFHTLDLVLFELLTIIVWFNPVIYFYKNTIRSIHEYLADEQAAKFQGDKEQYALLLLSKAFKVDPHMLTNNFFNQSLIKRRIFMLHKQRSRKTAILKYGLFVPLFALMLMLSSATIRKNDKILLAAQDLPLKEVLLSPIESAIEVVDVPVKSQVLEVRVIDWDKFRQYLISAIRYPKAAVEQDIQGNALIKFEVIKGAVGNISTSKSLGGDCDAEAMKAVLGYNGFKNVPDGRYVIVVQFRLSGSDATLINNDTQVAKGYQRISDVTVIGEKGSGHKVEAATISTNTIQLRASGMRVQDALIMVDGQEVDDKFNDINPDDIKNISIVSAPKAAAIYGPKAKNGAIFITLQKVSDKGAEQEDIKTYDYVAIEKQPAYPGGIEKFRDYITNNLKYPAEAFKNGISGTVYVSFTVEKDGSISNVGVDRKVGGGLDEEAVRVISASPKWSPGSIDGQPVRVKYNFPVRFALSDVRKKN